MESLPQINLAKNAKKLSKLNQRMNSCRKMQDNNIEQLQLIQKKLPKYIQICNDNMSRNILIFMDQQLKKQKLNLINTSENIQQIDRKIIKMKKNQSQPQIDINFITQPNKLIQEINPNIQEKNSDKIIDLEEFIRKKKMIQIRADKMSVQKKGKPKDNFEHIQRIITRENTPDIPILAYSSFKPKKALNQILFLNQIINQKSKKEIRKINLQSSLKNLS